jgi:hypothetical protein
MKILFITTRDPQLQGDYLEVSMLYGLRAIFGNGIVDYPRKKVLYGDFSESPQDALHGRGFTLYTRAIDDISDRNLGSFDSILYGVTDSYGISDFPDLNALSENRWYLDGRDSPIISRRPCFKRELFQPCNGVFATGLSIPSYQIRPMNLAGKDQLFQTTVPAAALSEGDVRVTGRSHYRFENEEDYYRDMQRSWFGITCKKGGWDCLRHYELMAAGACLVFRNYHLKPPTCSPGNIPCFTYSTTDELNDLLPSLVYKNKPTKNYIEMLYAQREWLQRYGTCESRATGIMRVVAASLS